VIGNAWGAKSMEMKGVKGYEEGKHMEKRDRKEH
jgi:hypothetical protein